MLAFRTLAALALLWLSPETASAQVHDGFTIVHVFNLLSPAGGTVPGPVVGHQSDADVGTWALYGGTNYGGNNDGIIYKLTPPAPGGAHWTKTRLYVFPSKGGTNSLIGQLFFDSAGAVYGAAFSDNGCSTVFRLAPSTTSYFWRKTTPFTASCASAYAANYQYVSVTSLAMDAAGALYVTTRDSFANLPVSKLIRLVPSTDGLGPWKATILHTFTTSEGGPTRYPVVFGPSGEIYGSAYSSSTGSKYGSVYRLTPSGTSWRYDVILGVSSRTAATNPAALLYDASGTIYGTGYGEPYSGGHTTGGIFSLRPPTSGQTDWTETDLVQFDGSDGGGPNSLVRFSNTGPIYGTTYTRFYSQRPDGEPYQVGGAVFELDPPVGPGAAWTKKTLALTNARTAGLNGPLVRDPNGLLYVSQPFGNRKYDAPQSGDEGTILRINP